MVICVTPLFTPVSKVLCASVQKRFQGATQALEAVGMVPQSFESRNGRLMVSTGHMQKARVRNFIWSHTVVILFGSNAWEKAKWIARHAIEKSKLSCLRRPASIIGPDIIVVTIMIPGLA